MALGRQEWRNAPRVLAKATAVCGLAVGLAAGAATASALAADACPNASIRAQQGSEHLTECRGYERVTDVEKYGSAGGPSGISPDGSRVLVTSGGGWADPDGQGGLGNYFLSDRGADRWTLRPLALTRATFDHPGTNLDSLPDLSQSLVVATTYEQRLAGSTQVYLKGADGSTRPASPVITRQAGGDQQSDWLVYEGAADDLSSYVFSVAAKLPILPGQEIGLSGSSIYEVRGAQTDAPTVRRVDVDTAGDEIGFACGRSVGGNGSSRNAVSNDGSRIFFSGNGAASSLTSCSAANKGPMAIYARTGGATTTEITASECDRQAPLPACAPPATSGAARTAADSIFRGASDDGEVVWFITNRQLADSDTDATLDLYEYRFNPGAGQPHLTQISAGDGTAGPIGSGADVINTVRVSHDGRRAYFAAKGKLTTATNFAGEQATAGANNVYLWERTAAHPNGRLRFVATLPTDTSLWSNSDLARPSALADREGRFWVFTSKHALTDDDLDTAADIYRYDAQTGEIVRVSVGRDGYDNNGNAPDLSANMRGEDNALQGNRRLAGASPDGSRILFGTRERLQDDDEPDTPDVYQWHDGAVSMVSSGRDQSTSAFLYFGITPDGAGIFFGSVLPLVSDDTDTTTDIYMARIDGGFTPRVPEVREPCTGDGCQGANRPLPAPAAPVTPLFVGPGNLAVPDMKPATKAVKPKVSGRKTVRGSTRATLRVRVDGKGRLRSSGSGLSRTSRAVKRAGTYKLVVKLSKRARATLRRKHRIRVNARVTFKTTDGNVETARVRLTFKHAAKGKAGR